MAKPGATKLRRGTPILHVGQKMVQIGTTLRHSVVFSNVVAEDLLWLQQNTEDSKKRRHVAETSPAPHTRARRRRMLHELQAAGLTATTPAIKAQNARVRIVGLDMVGCILSRLFAATGLGSLDLRDTRPITPVVEPLFSTDSKGLPRKAVLETELARPGLTLGRQMVPHLVVSTHSRVVSDEIAGVLLSQELPHLPVVTDDREIVVGPLVIPGVTCCIFCLDWHRSEHIPKWMELKHELQQLEPAEEVPQLAYIAAGIAASLFFELTDPQATQTASRSTGADWYSGLTWRITTEGVTTERWQPHPKCGCILG